MLRVRVLFAALLLSFACDREPSKPEAKTEAKTEVGPTQKPTEAPTPPPSTPESPPRDVKPSGEVREVVVDGLKMSVPIEWVHTPGAGQMRKAEFSMPGPEGDAQLLVYRFAGGAGTAEQNIERWRGQVELAVGTVEKTISLEVGGLKITGIDLRGRYAGQNMPGAPAQPPIDRARMLAVAIEGSGDPYYFKFVGAARSVDVWVSAWDQLLAALAPA